MLRFISTRLGLGALLAATLLGVSPATSQTATADELNIVQLDGITPGTPAGSLDRSGGLVGFARGIKLPAGPGHRSGPFLLGTWNARGVGRTFKFEFRTHHGVPSNGNVPGMNTEDSRCTKYIDFRYKNASRETAAASAYTVLRRQNEPGFRHYNRWLVHHHKISKSLRERAAKINTACKHHSPYKASMQTEKVYFGQAGTGVTTVVSATGLTAPSGLAVYTVGSNATISDAARQLNSGGRAGFKFRVIDLDGANAQSTVTGPDATRADLLVTPDGKTRLLHNSYKTTVSASDKLRQKVLAKPTVTTNDPYASTGTGTVKVTAKVPARAGMPVRFTARNAGKNHRWFVKPGGKHATKFHAIDASKVTLSYCYVKHVHQSCASPTHTYAGTPEVVVPAWINAADGGSHCCSATGTTVKEILTVPSSSKRYYRAWVMLNDNVVQTLDLSSAAGTVPRPVNVKKGHLQIRFMAYRNSDYTGALFKHDGKVAYKYVYDQTFN